jgi:tellurite resistance protein TerC
MEKFVYLKEGLSVILLWVGIKMIVGHAFFKIPTALSLGVIVVVLTVAIVASIKKVRASEVH